VASKTLVTAASVALLAGCAGQEAEKGPAGVVADCSMQSGADFGPAFADPGNLVVGPLALVGGAEPTAAHVVRRHGGQKYPLLVRAGHTVRVRAEATARLAYGPLPQGELNLEDGHPGRDIRRLLRRRVDEHRGWPCHLLVRVHPHARPACVQLEIHVDDDPSGWHAVVPVGPDNC
jgi:hypothetical protein